MQKRVINFGIIGCGLMGREFGSAVARWCHLLDQDVVPRIAGVCDTNPAMLEWFTDHFESIQIATQDYLDLLNSPSIDAIYCAVPHNLHERLYVDIIEAGKHLLGEKPLLIPIRADSLLSPDLTLWKYPPRPEERLPEVFFFTPEAYHQRLQDRLHLAQQHASRSSKTILLGDAVADGSIVHDETSEWLR